jgi:hypothetical protein
MNEEQLDFTDDMYEGKSIWVSLKFPRGLSGDLSSSNPQLVAQPLVEDTMIVLDSIIIQELGGSNLHAEDGTGPS